MIFEPERHEALCDSAWDMSVAREAVRSIVQDIEQNQFAEGHWPMHPLDDEGDTPATGFNSLYLGSAGVLWVLSYLQREGAVELRGDPAEGMQRADAAYRAHPDTGEVVPSYFLGEVGILLVLWRLTGARSAEDRIYTAVKSNIGNPTNEALWAAPGTMVAAWHLWQATREERWRDLFLENVEQLWRTWIFDAQAQCYLWTQDLYGKVVQYLGAAHGFAGNVYPLLRGASLLDAGRREELYDRCVATLRATAKVEDGAVNWPPGLYVPRPGGARMLLQWCHGAPGMVTATADFPRQHSEQMDAHAGRSGPCHLEGRTADEGIRPVPRDGGQWLRFPAAVRRTGDPLWLERARSFAMHSIAQRDRMRQQYGRGRYTLWTGDPGLAVYLWQCLEGTAGLPALDIL